MLKTAKQLQTNKQSLSQKNPVSQHKNIYKIKTNRYKTIFPNLSKTAITITSNSIKKINSINNKKIITNKIVTKMKMKEKSIRM